NGLYLAKINPQITPQPEIEQINIDLKVEPGPRAHFGGLNVEGTPERPIASITRSTHWRRFLLNSWRPVTENRLQSGIENIRSYYQKQERLLAKVSLSRLDYIEETNSVLPTVKIEAGPVVKVRAEGAKVSRGKLK